MKDLFFLKKKNRLEDLMLPTADGVQLMFADSIKSLRVIAGETG